MVRQRVAVLVLQRLDRAAANVLRFAAPLRNYGIMGRLLIGVSLEEGGGCDQLVDELGERRRVAWRQPNSRPVTKMSCCRPHLFCSGKAVDQLEFGG